MEEIKTTVKKWGNSFGIVIPKEIVNREGLKEDAEVLITIKSKRYTTVEDIFGVLKRKSKKTTQEIMDEIDNELWLEDIWDISLIVVQL